MKLEVTIGEELFWAGELPDGDFSWDVGRRDGSSLQLTDGSVSRSHAVLARIDGVLTLVDQGSKRGTWAAGSRLEGPMVLAAGDEFTIGPYKLRVTDSKRTEEQQKEVVMVSATMSAAKDISPAEKSVAQQPRVEEAPDIPIDLPEEIKTASRLCSEECMRLKVKLHKYIVNEMNLSEDALKEFDAEMREKLEKCVKSTTQKFRHEIPGGISEKEFRQVLMDELMGLGPIEPLLRMPQISEIMVNGPDRVFVEVGGKLAETGIHFSDNRHLVQIIQRIVQPLGRHVDESSPMVDARLSDGSRVNAVINPLALDGASLTIRKFSDKKLTTEDLIKFGSMTDGMALFLETAVKFRKNILVSGGTGSGKTTLLNVLSQFIPQNERVVTVEDSAELKLSHRNIVRLEARPANIEGKGRVTIRDLVINCLRMRPDRIIVGECRGAEALDMLQAMNTGHDGSLTTAHANNPRDALARLENMVMMAGFELPSSAIREQIASAIDLIVQQTRMPDGSRKIVAITEVTGVERVGGTCVFQLLDIFKFEQEGFDEKGKVVGYHTATGNIPYFIEELRNCGKVREDDPVMSSFVITR